jgi:hypothetical protein
MKELARLSRLKLLCRSAVPTESLTQAISFLKAKAGGESSRESEILGRAALEARAFLEAALRLEETEALSRFSALGRTLGSAGKASLGN